VTSIPEPQPDADSAPFWAAARDHRLVVQRCDDCSTYRFPPRPVCDQCCSTKATFQQVSGRGRVLSWVVTYQKFHPAFADLVPYVVLLVGLVEQAGLLMYGNLRPESSPVTAGMEVQARFEQISDAYTLVQWEPVLTDTDAEER
jgi:uncharacterized OB-fold protein